MAPVFAQSRQESFLGRSACCRGWGPIDCFSRSGHFCLSNYVCVTGLAPDRLAQASALNILVIWAKSHSGLKKFIFNISSTAVFVTFSLARKGYNSPENESRGRFSESRKKESLLIRFYCAREYCKIVAPRKGIA